MVTASLINAADSGATALPPLAESVVTLNKVTLTNLPTAAVGPNQSPTTLAASTAYNLTDSTGTVVLYVPSATSLTSVTTAVTAANAQNTATGFTPAR